MISDSLLVDLASISIAFVCIALFYTRWKQFFWQRKGVPTLPPSWIIGNVGNVLMQKHSQAEEFHNVYQHFKSKGKKFAGYYAFAKPIFVPIDLSLIKMMLVKDFVYFTDHGVHADEKVDPLTSNLFSLRGQEWRSMRSKLTPTFTSGKLKMMFSTIVDCSKDLIEHMNDLIDKQLMVNIKDVSAKFTTDIIMSTAFGVEANCLKDPNAEFRKYGLMFLQKGFYDSILRFFITMWPEFLYFIKISSMRSEVSAFFQRIATETVEYRERNNIIRKDFMHLLIQMKNNVKIVEDEVGGIGSGRNTTEGAITMNQLKAQVWIFFLAGFETSSSTVTFLMYEIVKNTHIQDKLREEIRDVLKQNGAITYDALQQMPYMDKCINETLRLYPVAPFLPRECTKDYTIPETNIVIPKGCAVIVPILGIHRDPEFYPDPLSFNPERFSPENMATRPSTAWIPFGDGPRLCIGMRFGLIQVKVTLAVLLSNYKFTLNRKTKTPIEIEPSGITLDTKDTIWLNANKI